jgi:hypothetical protein
MLALPAVAMLATLALQALVCSARAHHYRAGLALALPSLTCFLLLARINTFGPLLAYKHFAPLLPRRLPEPKPGTEDAGAAVAPRGLCVLASLSARVGSTGDNRKGG